MAPASCPAEEEGAWEEEAPVEFAAVEVEVDAGLPAGLPVPVSPGASRRPVPRVRAPSGRGVLAAAKARLVRASIRVAPVLRGLREYSRGASVLAAAAFAAAVAGRGKAPVVGTGMKAGGWGLLVEAR